MSEHEQRPNPYIGPRAFERGEMLYGRSQELRELARMLVSERIVLCHSPSGAGKTSLIQASLIPDLEERRQFYVFPIARVNLEPPSGAGFSATMNRYVLSVLRCLEADRPEDQQLDLVTLSGMTLSEYMARRRADLPEQNDRALIFDQFEEILATDAIHLAAKVSFFEQLGALLRGDEELWALFAMREEFVAGLSPYLDHIPRRFRSTYRLPLLEPEKAIEAIVRPAEAAGVTFATAAAERLADDLCRVRIQHPDGSATYDRGPSIEPVQLQVVCYRLWSLLPPDATTINESDLAAQGDVNSALAEFYNQQVTMIAAHGQVKASEQAIREWFDHQLITPEGVRAQVLQGQGQSSGLDNSIIFDLVAAHLVRSERQRGAAWFELAHDRLIEPIRNANMAWREANQSPLQHQAALWEAENRASGFLLQGEALAQAELWAQANSDQLSETERDFLKACQSARLAARRVRVLAWAASGLSAVLLITAIYAFFLSQQADQQRASAQESARQALLAQSTAVSAAERNQVLLATASAAQSIAETSASIAEVERARAEEQARNAQAAFETAQTAQGQADLSANQQAAVKLAADQLSALEGGDPDHALTLALASLTAPVEVPQIDLLLSRAADAAGSRALLPGDTNEVISVAVSPDGRLGYTGDRAGRIRIWSMADGRAAGEFRAHGSGVQKIVFSPDGRLMATASEDRTVQLWDPATNTRLKTIGPHDDVVLTVDFSPDGKTLLSASRDNIVRLWDVASGAEIRRFTGQPAATFSRDGASLVFVSKLISSPDYTITLVDLATGAERVSFRGHVRPVQEVLFTRDGRYLISASTDSTIRLWDATTGVEIRRFSGHTAAVWSLALSNNGRRLLSSSADNTIRLWDTGTGEELRRYQGHIGSVYSIAFSPDNTRFISGAEDGQGRIWDVAGRQEEAILEGAGGSLQAVAVRPDGSEIIAGATDGSIYRWDRRAGTALPPILVGSLSVFGLTYSPDGSLIAAGLQDGSVGVYPAEGGPALWNAGRGDQIQSVAFSPDGKYVLSGSVDRSVRLWQAGDGRLLKSFKGLASDATGVAFSPDGNTVFASGQDWSVRAWDRDTGAEVRLYAGHLAGALAVAASPDGTMIATGGTDRQVILWDRATGAVKQRLVGHAAAVWSVAFSPDGTQVASGSADRTVRVWDVATGREIRRFSGHTQRVWSVAFTPDGRSIVSASSDQTVRIWRLETRDELIAWVRANRYLPVLTCDLKKLYRLTAPCVDPTILKP